MKFEALGAGFEALDESSGLSLGPARVVDAGEIDQGIRQEPTGVGLVESGEGLFESVSPAAVQIDDRLHAGCVHLVEVMLDPLRGEKGLAAAQMIMNVDDREGWLGNLGRFGDEHGPGMPVAEFQLLDVLRVLGRRDLEAEKRDGREARDQSEHGNPSGMDWAEESGARDDCSFDECGRSVKHFDNERPSLPMFINQASKTHSRRVAVAICRLIARPVAGDV